MKLILITIIAALLVVGCGPSEAELAWLLDGSVQNGNIQVVKHNIASGADVNVKDESGSTPLHSAALFGYREISELLIAKGANVNAKNDAGETPLDWASPSSRFPKGHPETADLLRKHGGKTAEELKAEGK